MRNLVELAAVAAALSIGATAASSAVIINIVQSGGHTIVSESGSIDLTNTTYVGGGGGAPLDDYLSSRAASIDMGTTTSYNLYGGLAGDPTSFGDAATATAIASTGDYFSILGRDGRFGLSSSYISGSALSGSATYSGSIASFGLTEGTYTYTTPSDRITINIGSAAAAGAVPEPATWAMMLMGFGAVGTVLRKRRSGLALG